MIYPIIAFLTLGLVVIIHEFGHYAVAKLLGIRVETFSLGFGPRLFGRRFGTTDYRLSLIPLGGYVKLGGDESNAAIEGDSASDIPAAERFDLRPRWHKFLVIVAGPAINILTALAVVFVGAMMYGVAVPPQPVIGGIQNGSAAERAGLRTGDRIVAFNGIEAPTWDRIESEALISPEQQLPLVVERGGTRVPLTITPAKRMIRNEAVGDLGFDPNVPVIARVVMPSSPAEEAGLRAGDRLLAVSGKPITDPASVPELVQATNGEPLTLLIEREGQRREVTARAKQSAEGKFQLGIQPDLEVSYQRVGVLSAAAYAVQRNLEIIRLTGAALGQIFTGKRSATETLSGPIGIVRAASDVTRALGWGGFFSMVGFLSLNLGVVNLLPIPVLDGGAITLLFIEFLLGIVGLTLSMGMRERIQQVGFVMLLLLMVFVIGNDLFKEAALWRDSGKKSPAATAPQQ